MDWENRLASRSMKPNKEAIQQWLQDNPEPARDRHDSRCTPDIEGFTVFSWVWDCVQSCPIWQEATEAARANVRTIHP